MPMDVNLQELPPPFAEEDDGTGLSRGEAAYRAIRDMLVTLQLKPGAVISEDKLTEQLGIGRSPIREAIRRLACEQLIVIHPRRGTFAADVNITDLAFVSAVRQQLEPYVAALAAEHATEPDRKDVERVMRAADIVRTTDVDRDMLLRVDFHIHRTVYRAGGNPYLESTLRQYYNLSARIWHIFVGRIDGIADHIGQHHGLLQAILDREPERARKFSLEHIKSFEQAIRAVM
jgi:DNA-binding GntR family transcriptional regulator